MKSAADGGRIARDGAAAITNDAESNLGS